MTLIRTVLFPVVGSAAVTLACFSERVGGNVPINPSLNCNIPLSVIDSGHVVIAIRDFQFQADSVVVPVGKTVTWVNCEPPETEPHTTTSDATVWDSPELNPGFRFSRTFDAAGTFPYHCTPHNYMTGKVIVQ